ncbi:MAG: hypothetical protein LKI93_01655 [Bifidobacteriaceae bacterium]|nr:hypothetical protein [Bifidobacteriaceae bacterium]MCI1915280.1 hypothetical protein [Bifidobacteriaceae bacterium]
MRGFRAAGSVRRAEDTSHSQCPAGGQNRDTPLVAQIVSELADGNTTAMVARQHGLPLDFVELVLERARKSGSLDFFELKPGSCTKGRCDPDPESLVCAGCPIMPAEVRRKQSLVGKLLHRQ